MRLPSGAQTGDASREVDHFRTAREQASQGTSPGSDLQLEMRYEYRLARGWPDTAAERYDTYCILLCYWDRAPVAVFPMNRAAGSSVPVLRLTFLQTH